MPPASPSSAKHLLAATHDDHHDSRGHDHHGAGRGFPVTTLPPDDERTDRHGRGRFHDHHGACSDRGLRPGRLPDRTGRPGRWPGNNGPATGAGGHPGLEITDIVFQNPTGALGGIIVRRSGQPLFEVQMANFRDLDYHFVAPYVFEGGENVEVVLLCLKRGTLEPIITPVGSCKAAVSFAGFNITVTP